jgi:predicted dehydrogenase
MACPGAKLNTMPDKAGVAVLGTGWVSGEHIRAFQQNPHTEVIAILSRERARAEAKAREFALPNCRAYTDLAELLASDAIGIVAICTPHHLHVEQAIACAEAGCHVLIEKPIALDLEGLRSLRAAIHKARVKSLASFVLRWNPLLETIQSMLAQQLIGDLYYAEVDYLNAIGPSYSGYQWIIKQQYGVSSLLTAGCHAVDALCWFLRREALEVFAYSNCSQRNPRRFEYPPNTVAVIKFAGGITGKVASSLECDMPYTFNIELLGDEGAIRNNQVFSRRWPDQNAWATIPTVLPDSGDVTHHPFLAEINHFVDCILSDRESHCNVADAYRTHELCLAADLSAREGSPIRLPL